MKARRAKSTLRLLFLVAALVLVVSGQALVSTAQDTKPKIVIAHNLDPDHIELHHFRNIGGYMATANLYEPMITQVLKADDNGVLVGQREFEGAGAESYEVSDDGTEFTFHLRHDAKFADGTPVTANDYYYTIDRSLNGTGYIGLLLPFIALDSMDQVEVIDDYTLKVTTHQPAALTETVFAFQVYGAMSKATAEEHATAEDPWADDWHYTNANPSGPYEITKWEPGVELDFDPNPNYWRGPDWYQNSGVVYRVVSDASTREQLIRSGDVDIAFNVPYSSLADMESNPDLNVISIPNTRIWYLGMNVNAAPLDDVRVRQAISMAVPYDAMIQNLIYGYGSQPTSPIPAGMEGHTDEFWTYDNASIDDAKALLAEAGYPDGFDIELSVNQGEQTVVDAATWIQAGLADIGINVTINPVPSAEYIGLLNSHELPLFIHEWYSWGNDPFYQLSFLLKCGQFTNYANYCNQEVDDLIQQGIYSRDAAEREQLVRRAQEIIVNDAPWAYLFSPDQVIVTRANVTGINVFDDQMLRFGYLGKS